MIQPGTGIVANPLVPGAGLFVNDVNSLEALDPSGMTVGTWCYCLAKAAVYQITVSNASVDHDTTCSVNGVTGVRWLKFTGGGGAAATVDWMTQAFLYSKSVFNTLTGFYPWTFDRGTTGTYAQDNVAGTGTALINAGVVNGGVITVDTGATANSTSGIHPTGSPALLTSLKNGGPYVVIFRVKFTATVDSVTQMAFGLTSAASPGSFTTIVGMRGAADQAHISLAIQAGGTTVQASSQALDSSQMVDVGFTFDGANLQAIYGDVEAGTIAPLSGCLITDLTNMNTGAATLWGIGANGATAASRAFSINKAILCYRS